MSDPAISGYEIVGNLGEGGMGTVYLARQRSLNRYVAIKILPPNLACDESYVMRFRQESQAAANLKHPGIVQIYDAGEDKGVYYFVMEFANGETVGQRVRRKGRIDGESALLIGESVAIALEYAWAQARLVHRDIKPDNILIDGDGTVKVADLGLAKTFDSAENTITIDKVAMGTPHYCSPEQARGDRDVDFRADIYGLGATMYHLVTGAAPFSDNPGVSAMVRNITDYLPDPVDVCPDLSENFSWLLEKMMAKDRRYRHASWQDVLEDINRVVNGLSPVSAPLTPGLSTVSRSRNRAKPRRSFWKKKKHDKVLALQNDAVTVIQTETGTQSLVFRVFLVCAAVFTVILYLIWFQMDKQRRVLSTMGRHGHEKMIPAVVDGVISKEDVEK